MSFMPDVIPKSYPPEKMSGTKPCPTYMAKDIGQPVDYTGERPVTQPVTNRLIGGKSKMYQEAKSSYRVSLPLFIELWHNDRPLIVCAGHNLSAEGMLLELNDAVLPLGATIMLQLHAENRVWSIPATVIHSNANCMGVMFLQQQPELYRFAINPESGDRSTKKSNRPIRNSHWSGWHPGN
jgi:hypothetical protein